MRRTERELTDVEIIDAFNYIVDLICDCYNHPVRSEFEKGTRSAQIGHDIVHAMTQRDILSRYSKIGYDTQRYLLDKRITETGDNYHQERMEIQK